MAGLLDMGTGFAGGLLDPNTASLYGLAQGLLAASGASRLPVTFGAAAANALQGGMGAVAQSQNLRAAQLQNEMAQYTMQRARWQMQMLQQAADSLNHPGQPQQQGAVQDTNPQRTAALLNQPAGPYAGPSPSAADLMQQYQQQPAPQMAAPQQLGTPSYFDPQGMYQQGYLFTLAGIPGGSEMMRTALQFDPNVAAAMPTDAYKTALAAAGGDPVRAQQFLVAQQYKGTDWMTVGPGGQASMVPGASEAQSTAAAAKARAEAQAKAPYEVATSMARYASRPIVLSPGQVATSNPMLDYAMQLAGISGPGAAAGPAAGPPPIQSVRQFTGAATAPAPAAAPASSAPASLPLGGGGGGRFNISGPSPYSVHLAEGLGQEDSKHMSQVREDAAAARDLLGNIANMRAVIDNKASFSPGAGAENWNTYVAPYLARLPLPGGGKVPSYQTFTSNAKQYAVAAARAAGLKEPDALVSAFPAADQTRRALQIILTQQEATQNFKLAKEQFMGSYLERNKTLQGSDETWNRKATQQGFFYRALWENYPDVARAYYGGLPPTTKKAIDGQMAALDSLGLQ